MTKRSIAVVVAFALCFSFSALSQRSSQPSGGHTDVYINVTFENGTAAPAYKVQLLSLYRQPLGVELTNDRGIALFRGLNPGEYRLEVTGIDVVPVEGGFIVQSHGLFDTTQNEHIELTRTKKATGQGTSTEGTVSAATLNIPDKARKEFEKGLAAFDKQDFPTARERFTKAVEIYPQYCGALLDLGVIAMQGGNADEGKQYFERAMQADPQNPAAYIYLARVYIVNKDYKQAEPLLTKATAIVPLDPEPLTLLASSQLQQGEFAQAVMNAKKVHTLQHQRFAIAHFIAGQALAKESQPQQAADEYRLYLQEAPDAPNAPAIRAALAAMDHPK